METITIGQIGLVITFIVGLITGIGFLHNSLTKYITMTLKEQFDGIGKKIDNLSEKIKDVDMDTSKNFIVARLAEAEKSHLNEIEKERLWEVYRHYEEIGGNGYVKSKVEQLKADGKL